MNKTSKLESQIDSARRAIASDGYPMSIGELTNLYRDGELIIRPEFQRFFRWTITQKSRLVESLLLGIPLPSIFVAQTERGIWEVVDGLQRLSTILELQGELRGPDGRCLPQLVLQGTKYLPALDGRVWNAPDSEGSLSEAQRLDIKRAKLDIKIIKRESSPLAKFDLFQRLNSYGSQLNSQEMRSALLVASSPEFFAQIERMASSDAFKGAVLLSEKQTEERYDLELVTRFIILHNWPEKKITLSSLRDLSQVLDDESVRLASIYPAGFQEIADVFSQTFDAIYQNGGEDIFRRWDTSRGEFRGGFLTSAFEIIAYGVGYQISAKHDFRKDMIQMVKELWGSPQMQAGYSTGRSTESRLVEFIPLGRRITRA